MILSLLFVIFLKNKENDENEVMLEQVYEDIPCWKAQPSITPQVQILQRFLAPTNRLGDRGSQRQEVVDQMLELSGCENVEGVGVFLQFPSGWKAVAWVDKELEGPCRCIRVVVMCRHFRWSALPILRPLGVGVWRQLMIEVEDVVEGADGPLEVARVTKKVMCVRVKLVVGGE